MKRILLVLVSLALSGGALWIAWRSLEPTATPPPAPSQVLDAEPGAETAVQQNLLESLSNPSEVLRAPAALPAPIKDQLPLIISGRVVSESGEPIFRAQVSVRCSGPRTESSQPWIATKRVNTSSSGRFELRGVERPDSLVLSASKVGYSDSQVVLADPGEDRAELVLTRGGVVAGRVIVDDEISLNVIRLLLDARYSGDEDDLSQRLSDNGLPPSADGSFSFKGVGMRQVRLSVMVEGEYVLDIADIQVGRAGSPPDPRLNPLDLQGRLHRLTIELQDDSGASISGGTVALGDPDPRRARARMTQGGKARFLVPYGAQDFDIEAPGWRREHLSGVSADRVIRLKRGFSVRVVLSGLLEFPPAPDRLAVGMLVGAEKPASIIDGMGSFVDSGQTQFVVSSAGPHEIAWYLESGTRWRFLYGCLSRTIDIRDCDEEQTIQLDLTPEIRRSWEALIRQQESGK